MSHAIDRTAKGQVAQVMSGLLFVWAAGSIVGPLVFGMAMRVAGAFGLFGLAGLILIGLAIYMVVRAGQRAAPEAPAAGERVPMVSSPLASPQIVPREGEGGT